MIRSLLFLIFHFIWTALLGTIALVVGMIDWSGRGISKITRVWAWGLLKVAGIRYCVVGLEKLDFHKHYFFASNHESAFDIPLSFAGLPFFLVSIAKIELKKIPIMGWAMTLAKHIFIDRHHHRVAMKSLEKAAESLRKNPRSILIFPEGTRSPDGEIKSFKRGGLFMAIHLGIPVVPIAICGTRDITVKRGLRIHPGKVELRIGTPINTTMWKEKNPSEFAQYVRNQVVTIKQEWINSQREEKRVNP